MVDRKKRRKVESQEVEMKLSGGSRSRKGEKWSQEVYKIQVEGQEVERKKSGGFRSRKEDKCRIKK